VECGGSTPLFFRSSIQGGEQKRSSEQRGFFEAPSMHIKSGVEPPHSKSGFRPPHSKLR
jgi:hypothetical protein